MKTEYEIYEPGSRDDVAATFLSDVAIPTIAPGNSLTPLIGKVCPSSTGRHWEIRHVETYVHAPASGGDIARVKVHVFTIERDRDRIFDALNGRSSP